MITPGFMGTLPGWITSAGVVTGLVAAFFRFRLGWRGQSIGAEQTFRDDLMAREGDLSTRIGNLERQLARQQMRHNAERALDRHRLNNITQCFDAMLMLVETTPDRASEIVVKIKEMRSVQMKAEAQEKAIIRAAEIEADSCESDHDGN